MAGKLIIYPNDILRQKSCRVKVLNKEVGEVVRRLKTVLKETRISAGLAAVQMGYNLRIFGVKCYECEEGKDCGEVNIYINPRVVSGKGEKGYLFLESEDGRREEFLEGCLSFPGLFGTVKRWREIEVEYEAEGMSNALVRKRENLSGFAAVVFQHELDHLKGILFVDRVKKEGGKLFKNEKRKMVKADWADVLVD